MKFEQEKKITDAVIPLIRGRRAKNGDNKIVYEELFGTGFLIGTRGFGLTGAHVIDQLFENKTDDQVIFTHFPYRAKIYPFELVDFEKHPKEDVGLFKVNNPNLTSWLQIHRLPENSACEYHGWGYPRESAKELQKLDPASFEYPELIFTQGYVRRRIDRELYPTFIYRGRCFYEVSDLGGSGYSGSPIIKKYSVGNEKWSVMGIYIGEKVGEGSPVGYVVNSECFCSWAPTLLNCTVYEESMK